MDGSPALCDPGPDVQPRAGHWPLLPDQPRRARQIAQRLGRSLDAIKKAGKPSARAALQHRAVPLPHLHPAAAAAAAAAAVSGYPMLPAVPGVFVIGQDGDILAAPTSTAAAAAVASAAAAGGGRIQIMGGGPRGTAGSGPAMGLQWFAGEAREAVMCSGARMGAAAAAVAEAWSRSGCLPPRPGPGAWPGSGY